MTNRSRMSLIMGPIKPEYPELFALELGNIAEFDFVYTQASTNINQSAPDLVKIYVPIKSWMRLIMGLTGPKQHKLFALQLELLYLTWFTL